MTLKPPRSLVLILLAAPGLVSPLAAQETAASPCAASALAVRGVADAGIDFARLLELSGSVPPVRSWTLVRPSDVRGDPLCGGSGLWQRRLGRVRPAGPTIELLPVTALVHRNSAYPRLDHDGALWTGRGLSSAVSFGTQLDWGRLSATFAPMLAYQDNADFPTRPVRVSTLSPWAYMGHPGRIDWPQRFGDEPFTTIDPGQSQVSLRFGGFAMGYGSENVWWGPAQRYPLVMGAGAPGVPGLFLGTHRPVDVGVGDVEWELTWGVAQESDFFDYHPDNDRRLLAGFIVVFRPDPAPGLSLGLTRTFMSTLSPDGTAWSDFLLSPYRPGQQNPDGEHADDRKFSVFARWALPDAGFEAYIEWGRENPWTDAGDFFRQPDHSRALMAGFQKVFTGDRRWVRLRGEGVVLRGADTFRAGRAAQTWYTHSQVRQGHTHRGQLLGGLVGPGSDAQFLGGDLFHENGRVGVFIERVRYDDDAYYVQFAPYYGHHGQDVELSAGLSQLHFVGPFDLSWAATLSSRHRRNFIEMDGQSWGDLQSELPHERNVALRLTVTWRPDV